MKKLLLLPALTVLTGCAQYAGTNNPQPVNPVPVYAPMYDVEPLKLLLQQTQAEANKLEAFVKSMQSPSLSPVDQTLQSYRYSAENLYNTITSTQTASINYSPWQVQH